jgi:hypothetical protein
LTIFLLLMCLPGCNTYYVPPIEKDQNPALTLLQRVGECLCVRERERERACERERERERGEREKEEEREKERESV